MNRQQYEECFSGISNDWITFFKRYSLLGPLYNCLKQIKCDELDVLCPAHRDILNAFKYCPLDKLKVVIIGQDPYWTYSTRSRDESNGFIAVDYIPDADGLCFSTNSGKIPPSLFNIYTALTNNNYMNDIPSSNSLKPWAQQGVLLLDTLLTTVIGKSKQHMFWKEFTIKLIEVISNNPPNEMLVFMLWGYDAKQLSSVINYSRSRILTYTHPSPLCNDKLPYNKRFFNCKHFNIANYLLSRHNVDRIKWDLNITDNSNVIITQNNAVGNEDINDFINIVNTSTIPIENALKPCSEHGVAETIIVENVPNKSVVEMVSQISQMLLNNMTNVANTANDIITNIRGNILSYIKWR